MSFGDYAGRVSVLSLDAEAIHCGCLRQLEQENAQLKKLVAERDLAIDVMKDVAVKMYDPLGVCKRPSVERAARRSAKSYPGLLMERLFAPDHHGNRAHLASYVGSVYDDRFLCSGWGCVC